MAFCTPACVRPANSSIITYNQRPTSSLKTFLRRQLFKKSSSSSSRPTIRRSTQNHSHSSARFQRIKGYNFVQEINPITECSFKTDSTNNYDMTVYHDDSLDDTQSTLSSRPSKKIPRWARKSQLQLAFINQIYFNEKQPEEIFGHVQIELAREMIKSIPLENIDLKFLSYSTLPPNFV